MTAGPETDKRYTPRSARVVQENPLLADALRGRFEELITHNGAGIVPRVKSGIRNDEGVRTEFATVTIEGDTWSASGSRHFELGEGNEATLTQEVVIFTDRSSGIAFQASTSGEETTYALYTDVNTDRQASFPFDPENGGAPYDQGKITAALDILEQIPRA